MIALSRSMRLASFLFLCAALSLRADPPLIAPSATPRMGDEYQSAALYTPPDPAVGGGLHMISPVPLQIALAIPESNQEHVYRATLGSDGKDVSFSHIPVSMYDLVLITGDHFYEGISLNRDENSLTDTDLKAIEEIFSRSVPFFNVKRTEAVKGTPGDNGQATALVQWTRTGDNLLNQNGDHLVGHQIRSLRLAFLADVGPGWQVTATREILRTAVFPDMTKGFLPIIYVDALNGIRVTDSVKDIGTVTLSAGSPLNDLPP